MKAHRKQLLFEKTAVASSVYLSNKNETYTGWLIYRRHLALGCGRNCDIQAVSLRSYAS